MRINIVAFGDDSYLGELDFGRELTAQHTFGGIAGFILETSLSPIRSVCFFFHGRVEHRSARLWEESFRSEPFRLCGRDRHQEPEVGLELACQPSKSVDNFYEAARCQTPFFILTSNGFHLL